ncbi:MFS transporter [Erysipelothrix rhusiopathiae]|uniref:MFS transporter n=1 Tax=Erysipelothrix rhusiopathiae TaxID=1648 RepID=UPI000789C781|nr:MFS transporter [Erysipelothrix rhusiopathiae]AMS11491.1 sugar:proton symporter [Erysipelothrix rhusiopathiae]AOO67990.1 sugar:proton symporter [Erysipelothrix rhusiopathiae]AWU41164.1 MFS transporter [Erysipelothrix rhusiopathiae]MDV7678003.1 MFS transporter [Erysipelothrix rhusiopathiae]MDV7681255.1 MFS transporter [Erysipelothrix rhusiopathiae]
MSNKTKVFNFSAVMFLMYASHGLLFPQVVPFLTHLGYSASQRGLILSFLAIIAMVGQILSGYLCDRYGTIKRFFIYGTFILAATGMLSYCVNIHNFYYHFFLVGTMAGTVRILSNLFETWVLEVDGIYHQFSFIRSFGSLGWALASLVSGFFIHRYGYPSLGYLTGIMSFVVIFYSFKLEDATKQKNDNVATALRLKDLKVLLTNKRYMYLVVVFTLTYFVMNVDSITITDYIFHLGGNAQDVGVKWFVEALSEIPLMLVGGTLLKKYGGKNLMVFSSIVMIIRMVTYGMATSVFQIIVLSTLQAITFPLILVAQKDLIFRESPSHLRSTAQMFSISMSIGFSAIITPLVSGILVERMPIQIVIFIFGVIMIIPTIMISIFKPAHTN